MGSLIIESASIDLLEWLSLLWRAVNSVSSWEGCLWQNILSGVRVWRPCSWRLVMGWTKLNLIEHLSYLCQPSYNPSKITPSIDKKDSILMMESYLMVSQAPDEKWKHSRYFLNHQLSMGHSTLMYATKKTI